MVIIDKNNAMLGSLEIQPWERWFDVEGLCAQMAEAGVPAQARFVSHNERPADGLFVAWRGVKAATGTQGPLRPDELFENRIGMQLIAQLLRQAGVALDVTACAGWRPIRCAWRPTPIWLCCRAVRRHCRCPTPAPTWCCR
jgi:hypothetical protein